MFRHLILVSVFLTLFLSVRYFLPKLQRFQVTEQLFALTPQTWHESCGAILCPLLPGAKLAWKQEQNASFNWRTVMVNTLLMARVKAAIDAN